MSDFLHNLRTGNLKRFDRPRKSYDNPQNRNPNERHSGKDRKGRRRKSRAVFYDDATGETYVRRRRRSGNDAWNDYGDDF